MSGLIPDDTVEEVRNRSDIIEVISAYIPLKQKGKNFWALCPFHHEKTASFSVNPEKQIFYCFGCNAGGSVFNFLMQYEKMEFPEAVRALAEKYGIDVKTSKDTASSSISNELYRVNDLAAAFYHGILLKKGAGDAARQYLGKRGISENTLEEFRLGYAPDSWDSLITYIKKNGMDEGLLVKTGLAVQSRKGGYHDMFRKRLLFPIFNVRGKVIGFGGRVMGNDSPKYLNSPDTRLYNKGRELYGLSHTLDYIKESGYVIIVEGYMDFLTSFQGGVRNIAATLGTALTIEHIRLIKRYASNVVIVYDGDAAGELASLRGLDMLVEEGLNVRIVTLPEGLDPDDYVRSRGAQEFREKTSSGAKDLFDYKLGLLLGKYDKSRLEDKAIISREMLQTISKIDNAIIKSGYIKRLAEKLNVVESAILEELRKVKTGPVRVNTQSGRGTVIPSARASAQASAQADVPAVLAEKMALGLLLEIPDVIPEVEDILSPEYFNTPQMQRIADAILKLKEKNLSITPASLMNYLKDDKLSQIVSEIAVTVDGIEDKKKNLLNCISWLRKNNLKVKLKNLEALISSAQGAKDNNLLQGLMSQYDHLIRSRN